MNLTRKEFVEYHIGFDKNVVFLKRIFEGETLSETDSYELYQRIKPDLEGQDFYEGSVFNSTPSEAHWEVYMEAIYEAIVNGDLFEEAIDKLLTAVKALTWYNHHLTKDQIVSAVKNKTADFCIKLFGSFEKGEQHILSDVDLLIYTTHSDLVEEQKYQLEDELSQELGRVVNIAESYQMRPHILTEVEQYAFTIKDVALSNSLG